MVITIEVANFVVVKTLVDQGILVDILYPEKFKKMLSPNVVIPHDKHIVGFSGERMETRGYVGLYTKFKEGTRGTKLSMLGGTILEPTWDHHVYAAFNNEIPIREWRSSND